MKLLMGVHHYPPNYIGGVELITQRLAKWLTARGHAVEIITVESIDAPSRLTVRTDRDDGVLVHRLGLSLVGRYEPLGFRFRDDMLGDWFAEYLDRSRPDLFHSHSSYLIGASPIMAAKRCGVRTVITLHDYWYFCPRMFLLRSDGTSCDGNAAPADCARCLMMEHRTYRALDIVRKRIGVLIPWMGGEGGVPPLLPPGRLLAGLTERQNYLKSILWSVDHITSTCKMIEELLTTRGTPSNKTTPLPFGLDLSRWKGLPRSPREGGLRIGYLGQVAAHKGVHLLIQAFQQLPHYETPLELKIYGDLMRLPSYAAELKRLAKGNPRIRFCGAYPNDRTEEILAGIDVLVVPSLWFETGPIVTMEAFAAKVPVIASRLPNLQYQVHHEIDGLLCSPNDVNDLARQLRRVAEAPELLQRLAAGIGPVRTVDKEMSAYEAVYQTVLSAP